MRKNLLVKAKYRKKTINKQYSQNKLLIMKMVKIISKAKLKYNLSTVKNKSIPTKTVWIGAGYKKVMRRI